MTIFTFFGHYNDGMNNVRAIYNKYILSIFFKKNF